MEILKVIGFGLIALFLTMIVKEQRKDIAMIISIIAGTFILFFVISKITPIINILNSLSEKAGINKEFFRIILKVTFIAYIVEIARALCEDSGEKALSQKLELARKSSNNRYIYTNYHITFKCNIRYVGVNMKKVIILIVVITLFCFQNNVQATDLNAGLNTYIDELSKYNSDNLIDLNKMSENLQNGKGISLDGIWTIVIKLFFKEISSVLISSIIVLLIIIISSLVSTLQINRDSLVIKITNFLCYIMLSLSLISSFLTIIELFKNTCSDISNVMQVVSPFLLGMLIANGGITSVGIIQPLILFVSSFTTYLITTIIVPMLSFSIIFAVIGNINERNSIYRIGQFLRKVSIWLLGIMLTIFLGILSMETSISKDVDSLAVKTTTAAVSNFVPVVGKFFSDSMSSVIGASKIITKVGGMLGIITVIVVSLSPVIKIISAFIAMKCISVFSEIIGTDKRISLIISEISEVYKTMSGIIIANSLVFIISIAIMLNLSSSIVN